MLEYPQKVSLKTIADTKEALIEKPNR